MPGSQKFSRNFHRKVLSNLSRISKAKLFLRLDLFSMFKGEHTLIVTYCVMTVQLTSDQITTRKENKWPVTKMTLRFFPVRIRWLFFICIKDTLHVRRKHRHSLTLICYEILIHLFLYNISIVSILMVISYKKFRVHDVKTMKAWNSIKRKNMVKNNPRSVRWS